MDVKVGRLQKNLALIRISAGWSAVELGKKLGVSRQMISNLENGRNRMTTMQYLAIRQVISQEIDNSQDRDTQMLEDLVRVLVEEPEKFTDSERNQIISDANLIAPSILAKKATRKAASITWAAALSGMLVAAATIGEFVVQENKK